MSFGTATPRIASYIILRKGKQMALVLRSNTGWMDGYYGLVAGKVEKQESFQQTAIREAKEEAGIVIAADSLKPVMTMHRNESGEDWVDIFFEAEKWTGAVRNAEPHKHSNLDWLDTTNLPDNVVPSVKFALEAIEQGKIYCEYGWEA